MEEEKVEQRGKKDEKKTKKNIGKREKLLKLHLVTLIVITSKRSILDIERKLDELKKFLTILKLARDLQQVLSSQDPLTPWHLHSTFMFRSSSCKKIGLVFSNILDYFSTFFSLSL